MNERIFLIEMGDGNLVWCDSPNPDGAIEAPDVTEYIRIDIFQKFDNLHGDYEKAMLRMKDENSALRAKVNRLEQTITSMHLNSQKRKNDGVFPAIPVGSWTLGGGWKQYKGLIMCAAKKINPNK